VSHHRDDGSFSGGLIVAALLVIAFCAGYTIRDQGITLKVQAPPIQRGVK